ncbi:hypothetical protein V8C35DRAFT_165753, partial [Trichoderma chlorosporum]
LLSLDVLGASNELQGQGFLSLLVQNITHLDLCKEKNVYLRSPILQKSPLPHRVVLPEPESWIEDEGRRRLCWMVYVLDRYATLATPYHFMLAEEDMKRFLPCRYDLWSSDIPVETRWPKGLDTTGLRHTINAPENLGSFSYHCEVLGILSRVHNFLAQPLDIYSIQGVRSWQSTFVVLEGELSTWLRDLPAEYSQISLLCHSDPGARIINWIMLHAAFVVSTIRLNSAAAYPVLQNAVFVPSYSAMQTCLSAVESLRNIVQDVIETSGLSLLGPHFAFSLWTSARLLLVHAATMGCEIDPKIDFFVGTLAEMGRYWEVAANYSAILSRVTEEGRQGDKTFTEMRQHARELSMLSGSMRSSALEPTSTRISSVNELDYLEIFDFFNYPRVVGPDSVASYDIHSHLLDYTTAPVSLDMGVVMPSVEADWLQYETR